MKKCFENKKSKTEKTDEIFSFTQFHLILISIFSLFLVACSNKMRAFNCTSFVHYFLFVLEIMIDFQAICPFIVEILSKRHYSGVFSQVRDILSVLFALWTGNVLIPFCGWMCVHTFVTKFRSIMSLLFFLLFME